MKKLLFLLLTLTIVLCLASCDSLMHKHVNGDWEMDETHHWQKVNCSWNICKSYATSYGEHCDNDGDLFCDVCGYDMSGIVGCDHQWDDGVEVESGTGGYVMEYTCLLCGSIRRETILIPPENHFLRNQAGCEWLNVTTAEDVMEIRMFSSGGGPLPPVNMISILSSTDRDVISYIFEQYYWLDITPIDVPPVICDGGYFTVQFVLNDGTIKTFSFLIGEYFTDANGNCFKILNLPKFREGDNYTNYYTIDAIDDYGDIYAINSDGESQYIGIVPIEELQFIVMCDDIELGASEPTHYIELRGGIINFIGEDYFYFNDNREVYYQLIGKNLDELILEYNNSNE